MSAIYPQIEIERIRKPSTFYAIPVVGFVVKLLLTIPVNVELFFLKVAQFVFSIINSFSIFFNGKYWKSAHQLNLGIMRLETNVNFYLFGLTDKYPGFSLSTTNYSLDLSFNKTPSRLLATPVLGIFFRTIMLLPYLIYKQVLSTAAFLAVLVSWVVVLTKGKYPDTTYEIARDSVRVDQAVTAYYLGMSDTYPSWWISMRHKSLKILLLVIAALITFWTFTTRWDNTSNKMQLKQNVHQFNTVQKPTNNYTY